MTWQLPIGARLEEAGVRFRVWAPSARDVEVVIVENDGREVSSHALRRGGEGYYEGFVAGVGSGALYMYRLDGDKMRPDPASRYQPRDVHGPSQVVDPAFGWTDHAWTGLPLEDAVIYEAHTGTATPEGTFEALIEKLPYLKSLGVTAIELLPVGDFPGERNWGYDGVDIYAPARAYGGPQGLKNLVDAAHAQGLAVILDVVYNHLGPDGNYLRDFSPDYFTHDKKTPWGVALKYEAGPVREFFINNAIYWAQEYHVDGLRLDATHIILDDSEAHLLAELPERVRQTLPPDRHFLTFAEDERNEAWLITPRDKGGAGIDAVWADDFHHEVRSALAGDKEGYYADFTGSAADLARTLSSGWFYSGQVSVITGKPRGTDASALEPPHFIYCIQNHDQVGNRPLGDRLNADIGADAYRVASALLLLSPYTPLLFQGQEWAASTPFLFFTDHNAELGKMITRGRREEFSYFKGFAEAAIPDPQAASTFEASKLNWGELREPGHAEMLELYRELLHLRSGLPVFKLRSRWDFASEQVGTSALALRYRDVDGGDLLVLVNLEGSLDLDLSGKEILAPPEGTGWRAVLSTDETRFGGSQQLASIQDQVEGGRLSARGPVALALCAVSTR